MGKNHHCFNNGNKDIGFEFSLTETTGILKYLGCFCDRAGLGAAHTGRAKGDCGIGVQTRLSDVVTAFDSIPVFINRDAFQRRLDLLAFHSATYHPQRFSNRK